MPTNQSFFITVLLSFLSVSWHVQTHAGSPDSLQLTAYFQQAQAIPEKSDSLLDLAQKLVISRQKQFSLRDTYAYLLSKFHFQTGRLDSAMAQAHIGLSGYATDPENYGAAKFHNILGSVYSLKKEYEKGVQEFQHAIQILEHHNDLYTVALIRNNIANIFFSLTDYESAYKYSTLSYSYLKQINDTVHLPAVTGVTAVSAINLGYVEEGTQLTQECLDLSKKYHNPVGEIIGQYSLGELLLLEQKPQEAAAAFSASLLLSQAMGQHHYALLNKIRLLHTYIQLGEFKQAIVFGKEALQESQSMENQNTLYNIHKNLGYAYAGIHDFQTAYTQLNEAHNLYISFAGLQNKKAINDILIKYDTEKKEKELTQKALIISQHEVKLNARKIWILVLSLSLLVLVISYFFYTRLQRQKMQLVREDQARKNLLATIEGEEKERARFAGELHDGVASSITAIKMQLENTYSINPDENLTFAIQQLAALHEETRRISHNLLPVSLSDKSLIEALEDYCHENSGSGLKIHFTNHLTTSFKPAPDVSLLVFRGVQELIQNVRKHAGSKVCYVQVSEVNDCVVFSIEDEGMGFDTTEIVQNKGLQHLKKRLAEIGGELLIDSRKEHGSLVCIYVKKAA